MLAGCCSENQLVEERLGRIRLDILVKTVSEVVPVER